MKIKQKHLSSFWTMNLFTFSIGNYNFSQSNLNNINWNDPELHFSRTLLLLFRERSFFFGRLINPTISFSPHPLLFYVCIGLDMILVLFKKILHYIWRRQNAIFSLPPSHQCHLHTNHPRFAVLAKILLTIYADAVTILCRPFWIWIWIWWKFYIPFYISILFYNLIAPYLLLLSPLRRNT